MTSNAENATLDAIVDAAARSLQAQATDDQAAARAARQALVAAASAAMAEGHTLTAIAKAEQTGQEQARTVLRGDALKLVQRTGRRAREAQVEYEQAIIRATALGLSTREIASAAGTSHGTVRAIGLRSDRTATSDPSSPGATTNDAAAP